MPYPLLTSLLSSVKNPYAIEMSPLPSDNMTENGVEKASDLRAAGEGVGGLLRPQWGLTLLVPAGLSFL